MVLKLNKFRLNEEVIARLFIDKLCGLGYKIYGNIRLDGIEIDVLAVEPAIDRPLIHVYEIKTRPKIMLIDQLSKRIHIADYLYVVVPVTLYPWIVKKVGGPIGVVMYTGNDFHIIKKADFLGNGVHVIELMKKYGECNVECNNMVY